MADHHNVLASVGQRGKLGRKGCSIISHAHRGVGVSHGGKRNGFGRVAEVIERFSDHIEGPGTVPSTGRENNGGKDIPRRGHRKGGGGQEGESGVTHPETGQSGYAV